MSEFKSRWHVTIEREIFDSGIASGVGSSAFLVYLSLRAFVRTKARRHKREQELLDAGAIFASARIKSLINAVALSEGTIRRSIDTLTEKGWIEVEQRPGEAILFILGTREVGFFVSRLYSDRGDRTSAEVSDQDDRGSPIMEEAHSDRGDRSIRKIPENTPKENNPIVRPVRKAIRVEAPEAPVKSEPDPADRERVLADDEYKALMSARAKVGEGRRGDLTGLEVVASWRAAYFRAFGLEDVDLRTKSTRERAAKLFSTRALQWEEGSREAMLDYLKAQIVRWKKAVDDPKIFVSGKTPRFASLLDMKPNGEVSFFYREWKAMRAGARDR